jgi:hypothetical protein
MASDDHRPSAATRSGACCNGAPDLEAHLACRSDLEAHLACRSDHSPKARWILSRNTVGISSRSTVGNHSPKARFILSRNTVGISAGRAFDWASRKTSSTHLMSETIKRLPIDEGGNQTPSDASRKMSSTHRHPYERNCSDAIRRNQTQSDAIRRTGIHPTRGTAARRTRRWRRARRLAAATQRPHRAPVQPGRVRGAPSRAYAPRRAVPGPSAPPLEGR